MRRKSDHGFWQPAAALVVIAACVFPACAWTAQPQPDEAEIRRGLEEVFARPEFGPPQGKSLLQVLGEKLMEFFAWLGTLREAAPVLFWVLLATCILLLVLIGLHIGWTVRRVFAGTGRLGENDRREKQRERLALAYWEEARRRALVRDFTEAIRFLFLSLVYYFDERDLVSLHKAYTNREYLSLFADRPRVRQDLTVFVDALDDHWYGQRPALEPQYDKCLALYESLK